MSNVLNPSLRIQAGCPSPRNGSPMRWTMSNGSCDCKVGLLASGMSAPNFVWQNCWASPLSWGAWNRGRQEALDHPSSNACFSSATCGYPSPSTCQPQIHWSYGQAPWRTSWRMGRAQGEMGRHRSRWSHLWPEGGESAGGVGAMARHCSARKVFDPGSGKEVASGAQHHPPRRFCKELQGCQESCMTGSSTKKTNVKIRTKLRWVEPKYVYRDEVSQGACLKKRNQNQAPRNANYW